MIFAEIQRLFIQINTVQPRSNAISADSRLVLLRRVTGFPGGLGWWKELSLSLCDCLIYFTFASVKEQIAFSSEDLKHTHAFWQ